jgi:RyR domain
MPDPDVLEIARVCHEANVALCRGLGEDTSGHWDEAPQWQRDSSISGVRFALANPDAGDSAQHDAWMSDKIKDGWIYGEVKDAEAKTHPCIVPFEQLPPHQQAKDRLFRAIVKALT